MLRDYIIYSVCGVLLTIAVTCFLCNVRKRIRERDSIPGDGCTDCCISCFPCSAPCSACQMMRHEGLAGNYNLCSVDGGTDAVAV